MKTDTRTQRERLLENEVATWPEEKQRIYRKSRRQGNSIVMAHNLASRQTAFIQNSDSIFNASQHDLMTRMPEANRNDIVKIAEKAGIRTHGRTYFGQLGTYDDPAAWVSGVDDVTANLKKKGRNADGLIKVRGVREKEPLKPVRLAPNIVNRLVKREMRDPRTREKLAKGKLKIGDLREKVIAKHGRKVK